MGGTSLIHSLRCRHSGKLKSHRDDVADETSPVGNCVADENSPIENYVADENSPVENCVADENSPGRNQRFLRLETSFH